MSRTAAATTLSYDYGSTPNDDRRGGTMTQTLDREAWRTLLDRTNGTPTYGALVDTVARADTIDGDAEEYVNAALADGRLVEDADAGMFGEIRVARRDPETVGFGRCRGLKSRFFGRRPQGETDESAEDNPAYDPGDAVILAAFRAELEATHPEWEPPEAIELPAECRTYAFPQRRLRRVGSYGEHDAAGDPDGERGSPPELSEVQRRLRTRLEDSCSVNIDVREGEAVLVAENLGDEHVIHPDGRVEGGAVADRLGDVAAEYLGGGE